MPKKRVLSRVTLSDLVLETVGKGDCRKARVRVQDAIRQSPGQSFVHSLAQKLGDIWSLEQ